MAFISYKREDEKWAKWIQNKLESYKVPTIVKGENIPERIRPIFRDATDLSGGVLAKSIKKGLDSSKYLIVICSPKAKKSPWVDKEIQEFIASGREEFIIPFIVDGVAHSANPDEECFPASLLQLSADREILGININENGRDSAVVKVIARMLDVRFDTLWNRFQRNEKRKRIVIWTCMIFALLVIATVAAWIGWQYVELGKRNKMIEEQYAELDKRNAMIEKQNTALDEKSDSIKAVNLNLVHTNQLLTDAKDSIIQHKNHLEEAYKNLAVSEEKVRKERDAMYVAQSKAVAEKAMKQIEKGDVYNAMMALLEVMPEDYSHPNRPYVAESDAALRTALDSLRYAKDWMMHSFCDNVDDCFFSESEDKIFCVRGWEDDAEIEVYDSQTFQYISKLEQYYSGRVKDYSYLKAKYNLPEDATIEDYNATTECIVISFENDNRDVKTYKVLNSTTGEILWEHSGAPSDFSNMELSSDGQYLVMSGWNGDIVTGIRIVNLHSGDIKDIYIENADHWSNTIHFSSSGRYLFHHNEFTDAHIYNVDDWQCIKTLPNEGFAKYFNLNSNKNEDKILCIYGGKGTILFRSEYGQSTHCGDIGYEVITEKTELFEKLKESPLLGTDYGLVSTPCDYLYGNKYLLLNAGGERGYLCQMVVDVKTGAIIKGYEDGTFVRNPQTNQVMIWNADGCIFHFPDYNELVAICRRKTNGKKMSDSIRKFYFLEH